MNFAQIIETFSSCQIFVWQRSSCACRDWGFRWWIRNLHLADVRFADWPGGNRESRTSYLTFSFWVIIRLYNWCSFFWVCRVWGLFGSWWLAGWGTRWTDWWGYFFRGSLFVGSSRWAFRWRSFLWLNRCLRSSFGCIVCGNIVPISSCLVGSNIGLGSRISWVRLSCFLTPRRIADFS